jgi:Lrp/AsnC family transcriptional regulator for asnA, asnC and gidA
LSKLDWLDKAIITQLNRDARLPSARIARDLGVSERTVHNRIQRLIELQVIKTVAVVNPAAFNYTLAVDIYCELEVGLEEQVIEEILTFPQISYLAISTGDQDITLQANFQNSEEMHEFIARQLHQIPGIRRTRTVLIPRILRDSTEWLPPAEAFDSAEDAKLRSPR